MNGERAAGRLIEVLPEFIPDYEASRAIDEPGEVNIHALMSYLAPFYMEKGRTDPELATRYWSVVEELAAEGDDTVRDAVWTSLIEWFGWDEPEEQTALRDAAAQLGPVTKTMAANYVLPR